MIDSKKNNGNNGAFSSFVIEVLVLWFNCDTDEDNDDVHICTLIASVYILPAGELLCVRK